MKTGELYQIFSNFNYINAYSLQNKKLGNLNNDDFVIYLKDTDKEFNYIDVISKYGMCSISKIYLK
jgi:hypothetical protein